MHAYKLRNDLLVDCVYPVGMDTVMIIIRPIMRTIEDRQSKQIECV